MFPRSLLLILAINIFSINNCYAEINFASSVPIEMDPFTIVEKSYYPNVNIESSICKKKISELRENFCKSTSNLADLENGLKALNACRAKFGLNEAPCNCSMYLNFPKFYSEKYELSTLTKINKALENVGSKFVNINSDFLNNCPPNLITLNKAYIYSLEHESKFVSNINLYQRENILSVKMTNYENYFERPSFFKEGFFHFNLQNGNPINISDVIIPEKVGELYEFVFNMLKINPKTYYYKYMARSVKEIINTNRKIFMINYFYFTKDKVILYFSPGEIALLNLGPVEIAIPNDFVNKAYK